uniref:Sialoadhesin-like n=1 Tax=Gouania willdenowi TaxID=441366 RepID=A0A8C5GFB8_GOUWI
MHHTKVRQSFPNYGVQPGSKDEVSEVLCASVCVSYVFHSDNIFQDPAYENRVQYLGEPGSKNCSVRISDLRESDSGTYIFYFITSHPTEKVPEQRGLQLLVTASSSEVAALASPADDITQGEALRLACCSPAASPQANFTWNDDTGLIHTGQVWEINEITDHQSGSYYCQMQYEETVQNSSVLPINVQYPPRNTAASTSPPGALQDNLPVTLTCSSDANPPVEMYIWYQGVACLPSSDKSFHQGRQTVASPAGSVLNSANITVDESGLYCCVARNIHGSQTASVQLRASRGRLQLCQRDFSECILPVLRYFKPALLDKVLY